MSINPPFAAYQGDKPFLFVSYAHKDKALVYPLIKQLNDDGIPIWYDEGIPPSTKWLETIAIKIDACACFLVFLSENAVKSEYVLNEVIYALDRYHEKEIKFIPLFLNPTPLPPELKLSIRRIQALQRFDISPESFYQKLWDQISYLQSKIGETSPPETNVEEEIPKVEESMAETSAPKPYKKVKTDKNIIKKIGQLIGKSIPSVPTIKYNTVGAKFVGDTVIELGLCQCGLTELPESILQLKSLRGLNLGGNQLKILPDSINELKALQKLEIFNNQLESLPESFGELKSLKKLYLMGNRIAILPESFGNLKSLKILNLNLNQLKTLPESFRNLSSLRILEIQDNLLESQARKIIQDLKKRGASVSF